MKRFQAKKSIFHSKLLFFLWLVSLGLPSENQMDRVLTSKIVNAMRQVLASSARQDRIFSASGRRATRWRQRFFCQHEESRA